eukprot:UN08928
MWLTLVSLAYIFSTSDAKFYWSSAGPVSGKVCVRLIESADTGGTWLDNYLCSDTNWGMRWSSAGAINGMKCTQIIEPAEPGHTTWRDNFLCLPTNSPLTLSWSSAGAIPGKECIQIVESADPHTWHDNYLCLDSCHVFSAQAGPSNFIGASEAAAEAAIFSAKDGLIISLLVINLLVMSGLYCKGKKRKYRKVDAFSDSEAQ